jgi:hypothetical protein
MLAAQPVTRTFIGSSDDGAWQAGRWRASTRERAQMAVRGWQRFALGDRWRRPVQSMRCTAAPDVWSDVIQAPHRAEIP